MIKRFTLFVIFVVLIASGLFFRQLLDLLYGMSVLEMLQRSVNFVLHVIVVSILGYVVYTVSELVHPWVKTFQLKQRHQRRQIRSRRVRPQSSVPAASTRRQRDRSLLWIMQQLAQEYQTRIKQSKKRTE